MSRYMRHCGNLTEVGQDIVDIGEALKAQRKVIERNWNQYTDEYADQKQHALRTAITALETTIEEMRDLIKRGG